MHAVVPAEAKRLTLRSLPARTGTRPRPPRGSGDTATPPAPTVAAAGEAARLPPARSGQSARTQRTHRHARLTRNPRARLSRSPQRGTTQNGWLVFDRLFEMTCFNLFCFLSSQDRRRPLARPSARGGRALGRPRSPPRSPVPSPGPRTADLTKSPRRANTDTYDDLSKHHHRVTL